MDSSTQKPLRHDYAKLQRLEAIKACEHSDFEFGRRIDEIRKSLRKIEWWVDGLDEREARRRNKELAAAAAFERVIRRLTRLIAETTN